MVVRIVFIEYFIFVNLFTKIIVTGTVQRKGTHTEYSTIKEVKRGPFLRYNMQRRPNYSYNHYNPVNFGYWQGPGFVPSYNFSAQNAQYPYPGLRKQMFPRHPYNFGNGNAFNVLRIVNPSTFGANHGALRQGMVNKELPAIVTTEMETEVETTQPTETESTEVTSMPTLTEQASEETTDITEEHVTAQRTEDVYDAIPGWFGLAFASAEVVALTSKPNTTAENATVGNGTVNVVQEAKSFMLDKKMGFFTAFGAKLCDVVASMPPQDVNELLLGMRKVIYDEDMKDEIRYMGYPGGMALKISINTTMGWGPEELKAQAVRCSWILQNQEQNLTDSLQTTLKTIDGVYNSEEGNNLLECLQVVRDYPANGMTNVEVATNVTNGILAPYRRTYGTAINRIFLLIINDELKKHYGGQFYFKTAISRRKLSNDFRNEVKTNKQIVRKVSVNKTVGKYATDMLGDRRNKEKDDEQDFAADKSQFSPDIGVASLYIKPKFILEDKKQLKNDRIVEESSRSNEEKQLKMVLSDAIRHGDRNFDNMRRFNDVAVKKKRIIELSSFSDEEEVLKRNIYKVFGYNADLEVNN